VFSLGIEGGTLVTPSGRRRSNVYIADGRIAAISPESFPAEQKVDADGLLVLPGMVDAHVHFMDPGALEREDFPTGSAAAAIAGVTTVIEHTHARPVRTGREVQEKAAYLATRSHIDYGLAAHVWPDKLADICSAWATGAAYLKIFTCTTHGIPATDAGRLRNIFRIAAEISATCLVHCEDEALTEGAERVLRDAGRTDNGVIPEWRNRDAELASLAVTMLLAARTGAHVIAAHVSNPEALEIVDRYRTAGAFVRAESCPQYLTLREDEILDHGAFRKFTPPARARSQAELDAMWALLNARRIDYLSTDHAPATAAQKQEATIWDVHFGLPGIDTTLPLLLDAAARGVTSYERVVEVYSEMPARLYGFYPRKGGITVGADADLVLVDPTGTWEVSDDDIVSKAGWSPFAGRTLLGRVRQTYLRGQLIASDRTVLGACGVGKFIAGRGAARSAPIEWT
jgi:dihydroorotase (multifunctional complex type)